MRTAAAFRTLRGFAHQHLKFVPLNPIEDYQRETHWKSVETVRRGFYGSSQVTVQDALNEQLDFVLDNVRQSRRPQAVPDAVESATLRMKPIFGEAIRSIYLRVVPRFAEITRQSFPKSVSYDLGPVFRKVRKWERDNGIRLDVLHRQPLPRLKQDEDDPNSSPGPWAQAATNYVSQNGGTLISAPNLVTRSILIEASRRAVNIGLSRGWGIDEITEEIRKGSAGAVSVARARRIARTETIRASNVGAMAAADASGLSLWKEWIATMDDRVRETHLSADAQTVRKDERFHVGGHPCRFPADSMLPASESVNCRCTVAFLTRDG